MIRENLLGLIGISMAKFRKAKSKGFEFQKDAMAWAKEEKAKVKGTSVKIETNYVSNAPKAKRWEGILLRKTEG